MSPQDIVQYLMLALSQDAQGCEPNAKAYAQMCEPDAQDTDPLLAKIVRMRNERVPLRKIAKRIGVSETTVRNRLKSIQEQKGKHHEHRD